MRKLLAILVVCMVALAGCSTSDTGGTPMPEANETGTETGTDITNNATPDGAMETESDDGGSMNNGGQDTTTVDASVVPGVEGSKLTAHGPLLLTFFRSVATGPMDFETTYRTENVGDRVDTDRYTLRIRNDTQQQLYALNSSDRQVTYYLDGESAAVRNDITGEVRYSNRTNASRSDISSNGVYVLASINFIGALDWKATSTTMIHGEKHYVLESTGLNATALAQSSLTTDSVTSTAGRLVVGSDGIIHNATVDIDGETAADVSLSTRTDGNITVDAPSWYDESEAASQS